MNLQWFEEMEDRLGIRIPEQKARRWYLALNRSADDDNGLDCNTSNEELNALMAWLAKQPNFTAPQRFSVDRLAKLLFWMRKQIRNAQSDGSTFDGDAAITETIKIYMRRAKTHKARWELLCQPTRYTNAPRDTNHEECMNLFAWACQEWPDFSDAVDLIKQGYAYKMRMWRVGKFIQRG